MTVEARIERGREAARILASPVFSDAIRDAKETLVAEWLASDQPDEQRGAWAKIHALATVTQQLVVYQNDMIVAQKGMARHQ